MEIHNSVVLMKCHSRLGLLCNDANNANSSHFTGLLSTTSAFSPQMESVTKDPSTGLLTLHILKNKTEKVDLSGYDCLLFAIGRAPHTKGLRLEEIVSWSANLCLRNVGKRQPKRQSKKQENKQHIRV